jgi:hypothetical protein
VKSSAASSNDVNLWISAIGTTRTFRNVRYSVAFGGIADISN